MTNASALYCAICAAPCLLPRSTSQPGEQSANLVGSDTIDAQPTPSPQSEGGRTAWQHCWQVLVASRGLSTAYMVSPSSPAVLSFDEQAVMPESEDERKREKGKKVQPRAIPIHETCLAKLLAAIRRSMFNNGFSHEESMMLGWSIPKWTGFGPWVRQPPNELAMERSGGFGYWAGTIDQKKRHVEGEPGSHLLEVSTGGSLGGCRTLTPDRSPLAR